MRFSTKGTARACVTVVAALVAGASPSLAQTLHMTGPGGAAEDRFREKVFPGFEKMYGITVQYDAATTAEVMAKLEAQRSNQQYDVIQLSDGVMFQAEERGFCAPVEDAPVYAELTDVGRPTPNSIGISSVYAVIAIRTDIFAERKLPEPESWLDLGNPVYQGEVALLSLGSSTIGTLTLPMVARAAGGSEDNVDPGFKYFTEKIKPNLLTVIQSSSKVQEMLQTGEIGMTVIASHRAAALAADGLPVKSIRPKEGVPATMQVLCAVAGSDMPDLAQKFLQYNASVDGQQGFAPGEAPVNRNVPVPEGTVEGGTGALINLDWAIINANRDAWIDRWNREVEN